jgi:hypothetical protein
MRLFFLLLLLGNIAFFTWNYQLGAWSDTQAPAEVLARTDPDVPGLVMISERAQGMVMPAQRRERTPGSEAPATPPAPEQAPGPAVRMAERCIVAGPYEALAGAEDARQAATLAGISAEIIETSRQVPAGFWMLLEGRHTAAGARRILREMEGKGLGDIAITSLDDGGYTISLGIFTRQATLDNRRREIIAQGYVPEVRERTRAETAYSLRLALEAEDLRPMTRLINTLVDMDPRVEWRDVDCR